MRARLVRRGEAKNVLVMRIHDAALSRVAPLASGRLLDVGCGAKPYEQMFARYVSDHVGLDHSATPHGLDRVDLVGTAYAVPAPAGSFDTLLCTYVLEHLEEPAAALREARRVLRDGGVAIYSVPFIWHLHEEPRDFYRYSKHGLRHLFTRAGFTVEQLLPLSGFWATFGQLLVYYLYRFNKGPLRLVPVIPLLGLVVQALAYGLDRLDGAEEWTTDYLVVARANGKPGTEAARLKRTP